ncbi:MAG: hypothetical protein KDA47_13405, partial [Planctomycetales bacterium]|nr:hypothetical protein [Planctomycetales bacterium]
ITNANLPAAGTYYARVTGTTTNAVQMYRLDVTNQTATVPELSVNDVTVDEDAGTMTFTVQLSATVGSNVTFDYATSDASALAGSDYTAASGSATISSGSLSVPITVSILDDAVSEPTETFQLTLSNVVGVAVADGVAIGTINDDDAPALTLTIAAGSISEAAGAGATTATVTRNTGTSGPLTVNLSSSDTSEATSPASVVIPDGASSVTFDIDAVDDFIADGTRIVTISASATGHAGASDTVDVTDNDVAGVVVTPTSGLQTSESGGTATFTVVLTSQPQPDVLIRMVSSDVSEGTLSASSLTFNASNWNIPQTVTVTGVDDPIVDGDIAYTAILSNVVSNDLDYSGLNPADVSLTNLDNDTAALTLSIAAASISEANGAAATTATITRNTPTTSSLIVTLTNSDSSEISVPASVVIPNGQSSVTFNIDAVDDLLADGTKTVTLTASAAGHASASDTVDVTDNEVAALTLVINPSTVSETAGAAAATGVVTRNTEDVSQPLVVTLSSSDTSEATSAASVTILAGQASASFPIDAVDDLLDDGSKDVTFTAEASGFDS